MAKVSARESRFSSSGYNEFGIRRSPNEDSASHGTDSARNWKRGVYSNFFILFLFFIYKLGNNFCEFSDIICIGAVYFYVVLKRPILGKLETIFFSVLSICFDG